jgi:hypothetical protein
MKAVKREIMWVGRHGEKTWISRWFDATYSNYRGLSMVIACNNPTFHNQLNSWAMILVLTKHCKPWKNRWPGCQVSVRLEILRFPRIFFISNSTPHPFSLVSIHVMLTTVKVHMSHIQQCHHACLEWIGLQHVFRYRSIHTAVIPRFALLSDQ